MKLSKIIKNIKKNRRVSPDFDWLKATRESLESFILANPIVRKERPSRLQFKGEIFNSLTFKPMPVAIITLIVTLVTGGSVVYASQDSLPTDTLYSVKLTTEKVQEVLTFDKTKKVELNAKLATKRLQEIEKLQEENEATKEVINKTLQRYKKKVETAEAQLAMLNNKIGSQDIISSALKLEEAVSTQQNLLETIEEKAVPEYRGLVTNTKDIAWKTSAGALKKVEEEIEILTLEKIPAPPTRAVLEEGLEVIKTEELVSVKIDEILTSGNVRSLQEKAENKYKAATNKFKELSKKIEILTDFSKKSKCDLTNLITKAKVNYKIFEKELMETKKLIEEEKHLVALKSANIIFAEILELEKIIEKGKTACIKPAGYVEFPETIEEITLIKLPVPIKPPEPAPKPIPPSPPIVIEPPDFAIRLVPLNEKFKITVYETVAIDDTDLKIALTYLTPPCQSTNEIACISMSPQATIEVISKEESIGLTIGLGEQKEIFGFIFQLLEIFDAKTAVFIVTRAVVHPCPLWAPPHPDWCKGGKVISGGTDENGCPLPPQCLMIEEGSTGGGVTTGGSTGEVPSVETKVTPPSTGVSGVLNKIKEIITTPFK